MQEIFEKFGLSQQEARVFLDLVSLGASPVSAWAKKSKVNRSSMYVICERLKKLGLVTDFTHLGVTYVQAIPVAELPAILSDKQVEIERARNSLLRQLPVLQNMEKTRGLVPKVTFYEGKNRVAMMYENVLKEKKFEAIFNPEKIKKMMPEYFYKIPEELRRKSGAAREILVESSVAREYQAEFNSKRHQIKVLPREITFASDTIVTEQKIFLVGYSDEEIVGTEIWNKELATTQKVIFEMLWSGLI